MTYVYWGVIVGIYSIVHKRNEYNTRTTIYVTGGMFKSNGTTSMPKSVPRLVVDKVKLLY